MAATEEAASEAALLAERYRLDVRHATENGAETAAAARMELTSAKRVMSELRTRLFAHLLELDTAFHDAHTSGRCA